MKITYLRLENVAGLNVAKARPVVEIDFSKSENLITLISSSNGQGKSTLLSALQPFATVTSLDERSLIPFIIAGESGYKEIHYLNGDDNYIIKHYFKPKDRGHTVKSYFTLNDEELNENGNVTSFLTLVETHLGLTPDMIRLIRLGSNVGSFVSLKPAERKSYIGRLIDEIDIYLQIHRKISDELRVTKLMLATNSANLRDCHIDDPDIEAKNCLQLKAELSRMNDKITGIKVKLAELDRLVTKHDITELRYQRDSAKASLDSFDRTEKEIELAGLGSVKLSELSRELTSLNDEHLEMVAANNAIRISIDGDRHRIEQLRASVTRLTSEMDITSLITSIEELDSIIESTDKTIVAFEPGGYRSEDINYLISRLTSLNQIGTMLLSFGTKPINLYLSLRENNISVDTYLREQNERRLNHLGEADIKRLVNEVFQGDFIITPNCDEEYKNCPYYRFSRVLTDLREKVSDELQSEDILRYLKLVATNVDTVINEIEKLSALKIPDNLKVGLTQRAFLSRLSAKLSLFSLTDIQDYLTMLRSHEIYRSQLATRDRLRLELKLYRSSGADRQLEEIKELENLITSKTASVEAGLKRIAEHSEKIAEIEQKVTLVTSYTEAKRYRPMTEAGLASAEKLLGPLETASEQRSELRHQLSQAEAEFTDLTEKQRTIEQRLDNYHRLLDEGKRLSLQFDKQSLLQRAVSTKKGIPLIYVNAYQSKIRKLTNDLLKIVYDGRLEVMRFNITETDFEIPVNINGKVISDIRFTSQSEVDLITLALSFAISYETNRVYNIPLLDEIDGGLDDNNRTAFVKMLDSQLRVIRGEQCFVISHNLGQIANLPMDVIQLSPGRVSKLQNIIYEG